MSTEETCPIRLHVRRLEGVCHPTPAHVDVVQTYMELAMQRDPQAAADRAMAVRESWQLRAAEARAALPAFTHQPAYVPAPGKVERI